MLCSGVRGTRVSDIKFDWHEFRETLTGGARQLALDCEFVSLSGGWLRLKMPIDHRPLLVFADSMREQIGLDKSELRIAIELHKEVV